MPKGYSKTPKETAAKRRASMIGKNVGKGLKAPDDCSYGYGLTVGEYKAMLEKQKGLCAICGKPETRKNTASKGRIKHKAICNLCIDHNHTTGKVRALLCHECNRKLGILEVTEFVIKAKLYLEKYNG